MNRDDEFPKMLSYRIWFSMANLIVSSERLWLIEVSDWKKRDRKVSRKLGKGGVKM